MSKYNKRINRIIFVLILLSGLGACSTTKHKSDVAIAGSENTSSAARKTDTVSGDPFERYNRIMYKFNDKVDDYVLKPAAKGYDFIFPSFIKKGITNFFSNLTEPIVVLNDLLQAKFTQASADTGRFLVNTTVGLAGFIDVATRIKLDKHDEDFGQTLAVWGVGSGPYIVWPFLGPMDARDSFGWAGDRFVDPITYVEPPSTALGVYALKQINLRARYLGDKDILEQAAGGDPYPFVREAYRQKRRNLIYDGNPPLDDEDMLFEN